MGFVPAWRPKVVATLSRPAVPRGAPVSAPETIGYGFPRSARLTQAIEFAHVFEQGQRIRMRYFTVVVMMGREHPRLGLAVGRRTSHRAVVRNRIKRIARDVFRHIPLPALDIVVVARANLDAIPAARLRTDLESALIRLNS